MLGHRTSSQKPLSVPTSDAERIRLKQRRYTLGQYMEERADTLNRHFDYVSRYVTIFFFFTEEPDLVFLIIFCVSVMQYFLLYCQFLYGEFTGDVNSCTLYFVTPNLHPYSHIIHLYLCRSSPSYSFILLECTCFLHIIYLAFALSVLLTCRSLF